MRTQSGINRKGVELINNQGKNSGRNTGTKETKRNIHMTETFYCEEFYLLIIPKLYLIMWSVGFIVLWLVA